MKNTINKMASYKLDMKIINTKFIMFLILALFVTEAFSCYASCTGCTCVGTCQYPQNCMGVGPDCYCGSSDKQVNDIEYYDASFLIKMICDFVSNETASFVFPITDMENTSLLIKCNENIFESSVIEY